jgi:hypothetical protein
MNFPAREIPEEDPSRTGWEGKARMPAADPAEPDAHMGADAGADMDAQADAEATSADKVAYAPPLPDSGVPGGAGSLAGAGSAMGSGSPAEAGPSVGTVASQRWDRIQAMFVDDPRGSVTQAAGMIDEAIEALVAAARERQAGLAASWQDRDADTEELRTTLRGYRAFWNSVKELPQPA